MDGIEDMDLSAFEGFKLDNPKPGAYLVLSKHDQLFLLTKLLTDYERRFVNLSEIRKELVSIRTDESVEKEKRIYAGELMRWMCHDNGAAG